MWKYLIGNRLKINRKLFQFYFHQAIKKITRPKEITNDLERTMNHFNKLPAFRKIVREAEILLQMFCFHRPDIQYVQGMSFIIIMLLLNFEPYAAYCLFANLVVCHPLLFRVFTFDKQLIQQINSVLGDLMRLKFKRLHSTFAKNKVDFWNIFWIEWVYALFLRTFDLRTCFVLWDGFLIYGTSFIVKLNYVIFGLLASRIDFERQNIWDRIRKYLYIYREQILAEVMSVVKKFVYGIDDVL